MGHVTNTALNLTIVSSDVENGVLAIKGAIPGPKGQHRSRPFGSEGSLINHGKRYSERHR